MNLEKLMDKYDPMKGKEAVVDGIGVQSQIDSAAVVRLFEYMNMHKDQGIYLYQRKGRPYLYFDPGIIQGDRNTERWQIAFNMTVLFFEAADDLERLIIQGLIDVPVQALAKDDDHAI